MHLIKYTNTHARCGNFIVWSWPKGFARIHAVQKKKIFEVECLASSLRRAIPSGEMRLISSGQTSADVKSLSGLPYIFPETFYIPGRRCHPIYMYTYILFHKIETTATAARRMKNIISPTLGWWWFDAIETPHRLCQYWQIRTIFFIILRVFSCWRNAVTNNHEIAAFSQFYLYFFVSHTNITHVLDILRASTQIPHLFYTKHSCIFSDLFNVRH